MEEPQKMSYDTIYQIRKTITMAQKLTAKDKEFSIFVGADPSISETIALLKTVIKNKKRFNLSEKQVNYLNFFMDYLVRKNKALFASLASELSKLSFYLGLEDDTLHAT